MKKLLSLFLFVFVCSQMPAAVHAQENVAKKGILIDLDDPIPTSDKVKIGTFDNGLTYYIRQNERPEDILELRLVVNAGSILEDDDQLGLAHFMEHMNFNGTENFKKNELISYLQSIGVEFGADLNAYTGFGRTVYILPLPTDESEEFNKGFQVLEDWAHGTLLNPEMIDGERGVILEEYRLRLGAAKRMRMEYLPKILKGSRYAARLPIGTEESIKNFKHEALERFYQDWYRPGLMAVVAVGDMDVDEIYQNVKEHFAGISAQDDPRERKTFSIPNHEETYVAIASDKEAAFARARVTYMDEGTKKVPETIGDYRHELIERLFALMINNRLNELRNSPNPPFVFAGSYHGQYWSPTKTAYQSYATTPADGRLEGLKALLVTNKKVKVHGFEPVELERARKELLASLKDAYQGRKTRESGSFIGDYMSNYLDGAPIPGIAWRYEYAQKILPDIQLDEVSHLIDKYLHKNNRTVLITGPAKEESITEQEVRDLLAAVSEMEVEPYQAKEVREHLMREMPQRGSIIETSTNDKLGATTLTLNNGVKVVYKKTNFKDNEILMRAFTYGGTSLFDTEVLQQTAYAMGGLTEAGIAGLSKTDLENLLAGKNVRVSPYISNLTTGFRGQTTPTDLETMFQLIHLYFTALNKDQQAFQSFVNRQKGIYANLLSRPQFYFIDKMNNFIYSENPRYTGFPTVEKLDKANYDLAYEKYKQLTDNADGLTFYFIGDIPVDELKEFAKVYLASLPSTEETAEYKTYDYRPLNGSHKKVIYKGQAPKSIVQLIWQGETEYSPQTDYYLRSLGDILTIKLIENLREKEGGVYGVGASGGLDKIPYGSYSFRIFFPCAPEHVKSLIDAAMAELQKIIENGPTDEDLNKIKEQQLLTYKENIKQNRFWMNNLINSAVNQTPQAAFLDFKSKVEALSGEDIRQVAQKYLTKGHISGILYPEKTSE